MTHIPDAPADTRMMGIVHDALRRDLERAIAVLSTTPYPAGARQAAIGGHISWMMGFLDAHHHSEDAGLWPLVRTRNPEAAPLMNALEADHARIAPLLDACDTAARDYRTGTTDTSRVELLDAVRRLGEVLLPHLRQEEDELLPIVSVAITDTEWRALEKQYNLEPKSLAQLGFEGHWLLDGLDRERRRVVVHLVAPTARFVLVHGFGRRYRRRAAVCWGPPGPKAYGPAPALPRTIPSGCRRCPQSSGTTSPAAGPIPTRRWQA